MILRCAGEQIQLLPEKAFYWPKEKLLGFSDVHLGKAESLQQYGIPLPSGSHSEDLNRMTKLIEKTAAEKIIILGDLIHQKNSWTEKIQNDLKKFLQQHDTVQWTLLIGNHERGSLQFLQNLPLNLIKNEFVSPPFLFLHGHVTSEATKATSFTIQGHIHPVIRMEFGSTRLRLPCFVLTENSLTLPAFGNLTGGYLIHPTPKQKIFAIADQDIFQVKT